MFLYYVFGIFLKNYFKGRVGVTTPKGDDRLYLLRYL